MSERTVAVAGLHQANGAMRASDHDRERTANRLRHAAAEGRLLTEELEQRLETVFSARSNSELERIVSDLPPVCVRRRGRPVELVPVRPVIALASLSIALVLIAALLGLGIRRSSMAAVAQPQPPVVAGVAPNPNRP